MHVILRRRTQLNLFVFWFRKTNACPATVRQVMYRFFYTTKVACPRKMVSAIGDYSDDAKWGGTK